jgi:hypothetical protein
MVLHAVDAHAVHGLLDSLLSSNQAADIHATNGSGENAVMILCRAIHYTQPLINLLSRLLHLGVKIVPNSKGITPMEQLCARTISGQSDYYGQRGLRRNILLLMAQYGAKFDHALVTKLNQPQQIMLRERHLLQIAQLHAAYLDRQKSMQIRLLLVTLRNADVKQHQIS